MGAVRFLPCFPGEIIFKMKIKDIRCKHCNRKLPDMLAALTCNCKKKKKWKNPKRKGIHKRSKKNGN